MAWQEFKRGKMKKADVTSFTQNYEKELYRTYDQLRRKTYRHGPYETFYVSDPKLREINKASVRDRVVHHALFRKLYYLFDRAFIFDSYSCRIGKGTHRGVLRLKEFLQKESRNNSINCWALKCDIKKFFESIDHDTLLKLIQKRVHNPIIVHKDKQYLENIVPVISGFLQNKLKMRLHPNKIIIRTYRQGIDFLGYMVFPYHIILRPKTKNRILRKIRQGVNEQSLQSYLGILRHCNSYKLKKEIEFITANVSG